MNPERFDPIAPCYDGLNDLMSLGLHRRWKGQMVGQLCRRMKGSGPVLDVGCGTGDLMGLLEKRGVKAVGLDPSRAMLNEARRRYPAANFIEGGSEAIPFEEASFDGLVSAFAIRNFRSRREALSEWKRVLRPSGVGMVMEMFPPASALLRYYWKNWMPLWGRMIGHREAYEYLRDSVQSFIRPDELIREMSEVGLRPLGCQRIFGYGMVSLIIFERDV